MMNAEWLFDIFEGSASEIYVMDCETLRFLQVNPAAATNLQYDIADLLEKTPFNIAPNLTSNALEKILTPLREGSVPFMMLNTAHARKDGSIYPIEFRLLYSVSHSGKFFIGIGNDISLRNESEKALIQSELRFRAIAANTPGLVYQFVQEEDGRIAFPYLSEGCHALLGLSTNELQRNPSLFIDLILPADRPSYIDTMTSSASELKAWNWEGRIWVDAWNDIKWINLRSTPRPLANKSIQWDGIMTNITESKLEEAEIKRSRTQLAELSEHIQTVKEQLRTRIAREIHDDLGGNLTAIKMALALLTKRLPSENTLKERADYVDLLVDRTIEAVHRISCDLRPSILDFGLVAAIDWQAKEFEKQVGITCRFSSNQKEIALNIDQATALFRIFQEALTNIAKHANASHVAVRLMCEKNNVLLEITDNGRGFAATDRLKPKSFGIRGMMERVSALGGDLLINAAAEGGSIVTIRIPVQLVT